MASKTISSGHSLIEDLFSIFQAVVVFSVGILFFKNSELITGGTTGLALILSYRGDLSFGFWFVIINTPFFILAFLRMGVRFTTMTILSIIAVALIVENFATIIQINIHNQLVSAFLGGLFVGIGLLILFRHRSSMGGMTILSLYLQDNFKINAGKFQLFVDIILMVAGLYLFDFMTIIYSAIALVFVNATLIINHKQGRYSPNKVKH